MLKTIQTRIKNKHDTEYKWDNSNFVPELGELIIYDAEKASDTLPEGRTTPITYPRFKFGNGVLPAKDLPFSSSVIKMTIWEDED